MHNHIVNRTSLSLPLSLPFTSSLFLSIDLWLFIFLAPSLAYSCAVPSALSLTLSPLISLSLPPPLFFDSFLLSRCLLSPIRITHLLASMTLLPFNSLSFIVSVNPHPPIAFPECHMEGNKEMCVWVHAYLSHNADALIISNLNKCECMFFSHSVSFSIRLLIFIRTFLVVFRATNDAVIIIRHYRKNMKET